MTYIFSFITFLFLIYLLKKTSSFLNLVDKPSERKKHKGNIPMIGGIAIYLNFNHHNILLLQYLAVFLLFVFPNRA